MLFFQWEALYHINMSKRLIEGGVLYFYSLLSSISNFELRKNIWWPYLSRCLQKLSPLPGGLSQSLALAIL